MSFDTTGSFICPPAGGGSGQDLSFVGVTGPLKGTVGGALNERGMRYVNEFASSDADS